MVQDRSDFLKEITIIDGVLGSSTSSIRWFAGLAMLTAAAMGYWSFATPSAAVRAPSLDYYVAPSSPDAWSSWVSAVAVREEARDILLDVGDAFVAVRRADLGLTVDRHQVLELLSRESQPLTVTERLSARVGQHWRLPDNHPLPWRYDSAVAQRTLEALAEAVELPPRNAVVDFVRRERIVEAPGRRLNIAATLREVAQTLPQLNRVVPLHFEDVQPVITLADLPPVDPTKLLASFETDFSNKRGPRIHNIRRAADYLNGSLIPPGGTLSFNQRVGRRVASRGFIDAPVIVNDEMESGMGGGVCQVATTLHAAAVYGGLEITERRSHSRPSGYAPLGLDATVIDGIQDLKIKNPYEVPLYVHAYLPSKYVIRVELFGAELGGRVQHSNWVVQRHTFTRRVVEKPELAPGTFKLSQKGNFGYDTVSRVLLTRQDGQRQERRYKSKYYPVPEVLWVGPGTHPRDLPPPPESDSFETEHNL